MSIITKFITIVLIAILFIYGMHKHASSQGPAIDNVPNMVTPLLKEGDVVGGNLQSELDDIIDFANHINFDKKRIDRMQLKLSNVINKEERLSFERLAGSYKGNRRLSDLWERLNNMKEIGKYKWMYKSHKNGYFRNNPNRKPEYTAIQCLDKLHIIYSKKKY